ncbi:hypothetical protein A4R43_06555 [Amycolatopsis albispora]|uniref:Uncharacterized protein n=1 Tax=Amycolatopsis albispora TaxID=1804986 RepID=A0A344LJT7_9PSEU|nr:hypothetical protein A4R43_06555 [Amycolatopsis albispora]
MFRVTIRGKFGDLTAEQCARLAEHAGELMFSETGTFTHDANATVFTFRCQVPARPDDDDRTAKQRAIAALDAHELPYRDLTVAVTDLRDIRIQRKR